MLSLDGVLPPRPLKLPGRSAPPLSVEGSAPSPLLRCGETEAGDTNTSDAQEMVSVRMLVPQPGKGGLTQTLALPPVSRTTPNSVPSSPSAPEPLPRVQGAPYPRWRAGCAARGPQTHPSHSLEELRRFHKGQGISWLERGTEDPNQARVQGEHGSLPTLIPARSRTSAKARRMPWADIRCTHCATTATAKREIRRGQWDRERMGLSSKPGLGSLSTHCSTRTKRWDWLRPAWLPRSTTYSWRKLTGMTNSNKGQKERLRGRQINQSSWATRRQS